MAQGAMWGEVPARVTSPSRQHPPLPTLGLTVCEQVVFTSGLLKLLTRETSTWQDLTAKQYLLSSQEIPTPLCWYVAQVHPVLLQACCSAGA